MHRPIPRILALAVGVVVVAAVVALAIQRGGRPGAVPIDAQVSPAATSPARAGSLSASSPIGHIYVIVMENKEATSILGNPDAPFLNRLADENAVATKYTAVAHPSQPNYLALFSGSTQGVTDDGVHTISGASTLADQIESAGRSWHVAAENVPEGCFKGRGASGGPDGEGEYARKHNPAVSFAQIADDPGRCANITDFTHFDPDLGDFWLIAPNLCHDMHDCSVAEGDAFLSGFVPKILDSKSFASDGVLVVTFDEGTSDEGGGGTVATIVVGPGAAPAGTTSDAAYDHYSLVRTIEDAWGLPCLEKACDARPMTDLLRP